MNQNIVNMNERERILMEKEEELEQQLGIIRSELKRIREERNNIQEKYNMKMVTRKRIREEGDQTEENLNRRRRQRRKLEEMFEIGSENSDENEEEIMEQKDIWDDLILKYNIAERKTKRAIDSNRKEVKRWYEYAEQFRMMLENEMKEKPYLREKTARSQIYDEMVRRAPGKSRESIRKKTQRAEKIFDLVGKEGLGLLGRLKITSMDALLKLTKEQVEQYRDVLFSLNEESEIIDEERIIEVNEE